MTASRPLVRSARAVVAAAAIAVACLAAPSQAATADQACDAASNVALAAPILGQTFTAKLDPITRVDIPLLFAKPYAGDLEMRLSVHLPTDAALSTNQIVGTSKIKIKAAKPGVQWVSFPFEPPVATITRDATGPYTMEIYVPDAKDLTKKPATFGWLTCGKQYESGKPFYRMADFIGVANTHFGGGRIAISDVPDLQFRTWSV